ncbi:MAG: hypothetical protein IKA53_06255 [Clostridia bacterium]|nr:hypothetical protein [Clostridia bacterium]
MKKFLSLALALVLLCGCMFTLASCGGGLSGKYTDKLTGLTSYEFKGNKFTCTVGAGNFTYTASGTYEITEDGDQSFITFTYTDGDEDAKKEGGVKLALSKGTVDGKDYIEFGKVLPVKYIKQ